MRKVNFKLVMIIFLNGVYSFVYSQDWNTQGNAIGAGNWLGTNNNQPLDFRTNNTKRALFTTGFSLSSTPGNLGDGLRILDQAGGLGNLFMFA